MRAYSTISRPTTPPPARPKAKVVDTARDVNQHVARRLTMLRRIHGKTQVEVGAALSLSFQQMAKYERGFSKIAPGTLWMLAEYFKVDVGYFFADFAGAAPAADPRAAEHRTERQQLRLELVMALDTITDANLLHGLRGLLRAYIQEERAAGRDA
jgi:transcriptional regulator with XRE-family HTH domain